MVDAYAAWPFPSVKVSVTGLDLAALGTLAKMLASGGPHYNAITGPVETSLKSENLTFQQETCDTYKYITVEALGTTWCGPCLQSAFI